VKEGADKVINDEQMPAKKLLRTEDNVPGHIFKARNRAYIKNLLRQTRSRAFDHFSEECFAPEIMEEQLHIALVKINQVETLHDDVLEGIGRTLKQLRKLGLLAVVVFDLDIEGGQSQIPNRTYSMKLIEEADRIVVGIERSGAKARRVDGSVSIDDAGETQISLPNLIFAPLSRGTIPVLCNTAYDSIQKSKCTTSNAILLALTNMISKTDGGSAKSTNVISLDRIIVLDPSGGIPSSERKGAHVFVNLEQEYDTIQADLKELLSVGTDYQSILQTLRDCLRILPPTSSAVVTTPLSVSSAGGQRNPLIYNLLTDKPAFSPSLPISPSLPRTTTTLLKHGIPLTILPSSSFDGGNRLSKHPQINLPKLVTLIEDSFGKKLDVDHYLRRVDNRMAGVIIGGDYDGAALITWEEGLNGRKVPYLDKFAVARKSQGLGGVADVVFKAMILGEGMFPSELLWRSRKDNPVNKWVSRGIKHHCCFAMYTDKLLFLVF